MSRKSRSVRSSILTSRKNAMAFAILASVGLTSQLVSAAPIIWDGSDSTAWNLANNWVAGAPPVNGDYLLFTQGAPANQPSNNDIVGLNVSNISFLNGTFTAPLNLGGNDLTLTGPATVAGATITRVAASSTATASLAAHGLTSGQIVSISGAATSNLNGTYVITVIDANTFTYTSNGNTAVAGNAASSTLAALSNSNLTAGRNVTIANNLTVSGAQTWATANDVDAVTTITGNLSGNGNISISANSSKSVSPPAIRLAGTNSGYTGTISIGSNADAGILLASPAAQTGGLINVSNGNNNLWLTAGAGTYTFGITNTASTAGTTTGSRVAFRNGTDNNGNGIYITGGDVNWDPGNGANYTWSQQATSALTFNGSNDATPRMLNFGSNTGNLVLSSTGAGGTFAIYGEGSNGNNPGRVTLNFAIADDAVGGRTLAARTALLVLTRPAVNNGATASLTTVTSGALSVSNANQIFAGNLNINGGTLLLNNVAFNDFIGSRTIGTGSGQYQFNSGGFAARGTPVTIDSTKTTTDTFNRNFSLGSIVRDADNSFYANAGVTISRDTTLTALRTITLNPQIGSYSDTAAVVHKISGNNSGTGSYSATGPSLTTVGELVFSGSNSWTGGATYDQGATARINTGAGGMLISRSLVRFDNDSSLPTGNAGNLAYLAVADRNNGSVGGYLLTGGATALTEKVYDLPTGMKFLFTGANGGDNVALFGASDGYARLRGSSLLINRSAATGDAQTMPLLVRDATVLTLGDTEAPVRFVPSTGQESSNVSTVATVLSTANGSRTLIKRGVGTLVLNNVAYTNVAENGNTISQFSWQLGRGGTDNTVASPFFDGAVRETGSDSTSSLTSFLVKFQGAVLETSGSFSRSLGATSANVQWAQGGGGFSASSAPLSVNIGGSVTPDSLIWATTPNFVSNNNPLLFGSQTTNNVVTWQNPVSLNGGTREIRVYDNTASLSDKAVINAVLSGTGSSNLVKTGNGTLELASGVTHTYVGTTSVNAGKLLVNGILNTQSSALTVATAATLGGSGTINRPVTISGILSPGNSIGTLTVTNDVTWNSNDAWLFELGTPSSNLLLANSTPSDNDRLNITGASSDFLKGTGLVFTFDFAGGGAPGFYKLVDWTDTASTTFVASNFAASNLAPSLTPTFIIDDATSALYLQLTSEGPEIPEPASLTLLALGSLALLSKKRK